MKIIISILSLLIIFHSGFGQEKDVASEPIENEVNNYINSVDTVNHLGVSDTVVNELSSKIDSLRFSIDPLSQIEVPLLTNPLDTLKLSTPLIDTITQKVNALKGKIQDADSLNILNDIPLLSLDGKETPGFIQVKEPDLGISTPALQKDNPLQIESPGFIDEGKELNEEFSVLKDKSTNISNELETLKADSANADLKAEQMASQYLEEELDMLSKHSSSVEGFEKQLQKEQYLAKLNEAKGQASADWLNKKAQNISFDKLDANIEKVEKAQKDLDKAKKKYGEFKNLEEIKSIKRFKLDLPFWQRLSPIATFQIQKEEELELYLSPVLSYKLNKIITTGMGYTYLFSISEKFSSFKGTPETYGPKSFLQAKAFKSYSLRLEYEYLRTDVPQDNTSKIVRAWLSNLNVGIIKDINFKGNIVGQLQILYNVRHDKEKSPFQRPLMMRFGFGLDSFKSVKKKSYKDKLKEKLKEIEGKKKGI